MFKKEKGLKQFFIKLIIKLCLRKKWLNFPNTNMSLLN